MPGAVISFRRSWVEENQTFGWSVETRPDAEASPVFCQFQVPL